MVCRDKALEIKVIKYKLFNQTSRDVENTYRDTGAYDMKYGEFKEMCRKIWSENFKYPCFDMDKKLMVNFVVSMKAKTHIYFLHSRK